MSQPVRAKNLPHEGLETMTKRMQWDSEALPIGIAIDQLLYQIRQSEESGNALLLDSVNIGEIIEDSDGILALDALVTPYAKLNRKMELLRGVMERAGNSVKPVAMQITDPFKQLGKTNVAVIFELSDGQTVSIFFHNPDVTPNKILPTDDLISWKWLLNKKDITIVVAPERGMDLNVREVSRRIMKLAEKNSVAFARVNQKRSERMQSIQSLKMEISDLEQQLESAQRDFEVAKLEYEEKIIAPKPQENTSFDPTTPENYAKVMADSELQLKYQDRLDAFFQGRIVAVNNALIAAKWYHPGGNKQILSKLIGEDSMESGLVYSVTMDFAQVGAGKNVVGVTYNLSHTIGHGVNAKMSEFTLFRDDLTKTPEQIAAAIDASVVSENSDSSPANDQETDEISRRENLSIEVRELLSSMGWKGFDDGSVMTIGNYRASISGNYAGFSVEMLDSESGTWSEVGFMSIGLDKTAQYIAEGIARIVESRQKNVNPAQSSGSDEHVNALQSIVDGKNDGDDLTELLGKIEAAATALSDAGLADQYDQLIGAAAEKWAQLDMQANG